MTGRRYRYVLVGGGVAGDAAIEGIRQVDPAGSILLVAGEAELPYDRPPLSKQLWKGDQRVEEIYKHERRWYDQHGVELQLGRRVQYLDPQKHTVILDDAWDCSYERLLLATGGTPRRLEIPGGELPGLFYFRTAADYRALHSLMKKGTRAVVIGGGFIGSEIAAGLNVVGGQVSLLFPSNWICSAVLPEPLGKAMNRLYAQHGVDVFAGQRVSAIEKTGEKYLVQTRDSRTLEAEVVVVGIGIEPNVAIAQSAGLAVGDGIEVDEFLRTSDASIYAAGDVASFPEVILGRTRIEHWDNAIAQGKHAGANMAGAMQKFDYLPFFFSDLFEFGYEAVGHCSSKLQTFCDWVEENQVGTIYYLEQNKVRGVLTCGIFGKTDAARELIRRDHIVSEKELQGAIRP